MISKIRTLFHQLAGIDQFDDNNSLLSNIRPVSTAERKAAQIIKSYPHLKESEVIKDTEEGWVRVVR